MPDNPIPAIESAELAAKRIVQKANEDKASRIHHAREKADEDFAKAIQHAQEKSDGMLQAAQQSSGSDIAALDSQFEKEKENIIRKAAERESAAISAIVGIVSGKTS